MSFLYFLFQLSFAASNVMQSLVPGLVTVPMERVSDAEVALKNLSESCYRAWKEFPCTLLPYALCVQRALHLNAL